MNSSPTLPRPFFNHSYYELRDLLAECQKGHIVRLTCLLEELNHRRKEWPARLRAVTETAIVGNAEILQHLQRLP